jgi:hypothetical protein
LTIEDAPGVTVVRHRDGPRSGRAAQAILRAEGLEPRAWGNGPEAEYAPHRHDRPKVLYCVTGDIVFHVGLADVPLVAGDRLELAAGVEHAATVGRHGVECVEAYRA